MFNLDLKNANFMVPINQGQHQHLSLQWEGSVFQFTCLPFGLSSAPQTFIKIILPVKEGCHNGNYLLFLHQSREITENQEVSTEPPIEKDFQIQGNSNIPLTSGNRDLSHCDESNSLLVIIPCVSRITFLKVKDPFLTIYLSLKVIQA